MRCRFKNSETGIFSSGLVGRNLPFCSGYARVATDRRNKVARTVSRAVLDCCLNLDLDPYYADRWLATRARRTSTALAWS